MTGSSNDIETMDADGQDWVNTYYMFEDTLNQKEFSLKFHPAFIIYHKLLNLLQEYSDQKDIDLTDKEVMFLLGLATSNFEALEKEHYVFNHNDIYDLNVPMK